VKRISKKTRERAALICAMSASGRGYACFTGCVADHLGIHEESASVRLAYLAIVFVETTVQSPQRARGWHRANPAEAEALLRTGWSP
jgi:hypothetical protein